MVARVCAAIFKKRDIADFWLRLFGLAFILVLFKRGQLVTSCQGHFDPCKDGVNLGDYA